MCEMEEGGAGGERETGEGSKVSRRIHKNIRN